MHSSAVLHRVLVARVLPGRRRDHGSCHRGGPTPRHQRVPRRRRAARIYIEGVINTHFHADFVSGHLELVEATGAWIGFGEAAETEYPIRRLAR